MGIPKVEQVKWTDELKDLVKTMWVTEKLSQTTIVRRLAQLGHTTSRSSIAGLVNRMKWQRGEQRLAIGRNYPKNRRLPGTASHPPTAPRSTEPKPMPVLPDVEGVSLHPRDLMGLEDGQCHFPVYLE